MLQVAYLFSESHFGLDLNWKPWYSTSCLHHLVNFEVLHMEYIIYHHVVDQARGATHTVYCSLHFIFLITWYRLLKWLKMLKIWRNRILRCNYWIRCHSSAHIACSRSIFTSKWFLIFDVSVHFAISKLALNIYADIDLVTIAFLLFINSIDVFKLLVLIAHAWSLLLLRSKSLNHIWRSWTLVNEVHVGCLGLSDGFGDAVGVCIVVV